MPDVFQVHLEDGLSSLQVRQFHLYAAVETARAQKRLVKAVWPVGSGEDDHPFVAVEAVHLGK